MKATFAKQTVNKLTPFDIADKKIFSRRKLGNTYLKSLKCRDLSTYFWEFKKATRQMYIEISHKIV